MPATLFRRDFLKLYAGAACVPATWGALASIQEEQSFDPVIGVCRSADDAALLQAGGAAYVEIACTPWLVPGESNEAFAEKLEQLTQAAVPPRAANSFLPGSLRCTGPSADAAEVCAYAAVVFERASRAGVRMITFGSSAARSIPEGFPRADAELQFVALLARMAPHAERFGVTVCVEALQKSETNFLNRVDEAARLVRAVDHPNIALTADIFHMLREGESPESIRRHAAYVRHVHIAENQERSAPGTSGEDFKPYLQALKDASYAGLISIECRWQDLGAQLPTALATLREQIAGLR